MEPHTIGAHKLHTYLRTLKRHDSRILGFIAVLQVGARTVPSSKYDTYLLRSTGISCAPALSKSLQLWRLMPFRVAGLKYILKV